MSGLLFVWIMDTLTVIGVAAAIVAALAAVAGTVYSARENRRQNERQAADRHEFYGRLTAVVEGLSAESRRHAHEIESLRTTTNAHSADIAVLRERVGRAVDTGVPGVTAKL